MGNRGGEERVYKGKARNRLYEERTMEKRLVRRTKVMMKVW